MDASWGVGARSAPTAAWRARQLLDEEMGYRSVETAFSFGNQIALHFITIEVIFVNNAS